MPALATISDVEARLQRTLTSGEITAGQVYLDEVSGMARRAIPGLDVSIATDVNLAAIVVGRIAGAVVRVLRNPDGKVQESVDDYSYRRSDGMADGLLYLSDDDIAQMRSAVTVRRVGSQKLLARGYVIS